MKSVEAEVVRACRLTLLPLQREHAAEMATVLADPALHGFTGGVPESPTALHARYERLVAGSPGPEIAWCNWVIHLSTEACLAGTVQATVTTVDDEVVAEIAWVVGTPWQGRGIASEATRALVTWLGRQHVRAVIAHIHPDHDASAAVATAAGLEPNGQWREGEVRWHRLLA